MYTKSKILKINRDYEQMYEFVQKKVEEICQKIQFIDNVWALENIEIFDDFIGVKVYDTCYDMYDSKYMKIPVDWLFSDSWEEEWKKIQDEKKAQEKAQKMQEKKEQEEKEFQEYQRLKEKFKDKEGGGICNS